MSISEWCKIRQEQTLKRRLMFIVKVTEIHGRVLSIRWKMEWKKVIYRIP